MEYLVLRMVNFGSRSVLFFSGEAILVDFLAWDAALFDPPQLLLLSHVELLLYLHLSLFFQ